MQQTVSLSSNILVNDGDWLDKAIYLQPDSPALSEVEVMASSNLEVSSTCISSIIALRTSPEDTMWNPQTASGQFFPFSMFGMPLQAAWRYPSMPDPVMIATNRVQERSDLNGKFV